MPQGMGYYCYDCSDEPVEVPSSFLDEHPGHDVRYEARTYHGSEYGSCPCGRVTVRENNTGRIVCGGCARVPTGCTCPTMVMNQMRQCPTCGYGMARQGDQYVCVQCGATMGPHVPQAPMRRPVRSHRRGR